MNDANSALGRDPGREPGILSQTIQSARAEIKSTTQRIADLFAETSTLAAAASLLDSERGHVHNPAAPAEGPLSVEGEGDRPPGLAGQIFDITVQAARCDSYVMAALTELREIRVRLERAI